MVAIHKIVERLSVIMLVVGSFQAGHAYAGDSTTINLATQTPMKKGLKVQIRKQEVLQLEGSHHFIKDQTGKELRLVLDPSYQKIATIQETDSKGTTRSVRLWDIASRK